MFNTIIAVYKKNRQTNKRAYPWSFIMQRIIEGILSICFPVFIYYYIFHMNTSDLFLKYTNTSDYITYIVLGEGLYIIAFATLMNVGRCMIMEIREGTLDTFLLSPASRIGYFIGTYCEQFFRSIFEFIIIILTGFLFGAKIPIDKLPLLIFLLITVSLSCFSLAILISSIMVFTRDTYLTQNTIITVIGLVSGVLFPIQILPLYLQFIGFMLPITYGLIIFRNCIIAGEPLAHNMFSLLIMFILSVLYLIIGYVFFKKLEHRLIEEIYS